MMKKFENIGLAFASVSLFACNQNGQDENIAPEQLEPEVITIIEPRDCSPELPDCPIGNDWRTESFKSVDGVVVQTDNNGETRNICADISDEIRSEFPVCTKDQLENSAKDFCRLPSCDEPNSYLPIYSSTVRTPLVRSTNSFNELELAIDAATVVAEPIPVGGIQSIRGRLSDQEVATILTLDICQGLQSPLSEGPMILLTHDHIRLLLAQIGLNFIDSNLEDGGLYPSPTIDCFGIIPDQITQTQIPFGGGVINVSKLNK